MCLAQTAQAEAQEIQVRTSETACPGGEDREAVWLAMSAMTLVGMTTVCAITVAMMMRGKAAGHMTPERAVLRETRTVGTQSQTTYTALRGCSMPRFLPLPEHSHG